MSPSDRAQNVSSKFQKMHQFDWFQADDHYCWIWLISNVQKPTKQATKGQKQILEENQNTIKFYTRMAAASMVSNRDVEFE